MKIAILLHPSIHLNVDVCGGVEREAIEEMTELNSRGHTALLWVSGMTGRHPHVKVVKDVDWGNRYWKWIYYFRFLCEAWGFDIFHGHYTPALALLYPLKSVIHLSGLSVREIPLYRLFPNRAHGAHYVACSHHVAESFRKVYPSIPQDHIHAVHNAADIHLFAKGDRSKPREKVNIVYFGLWEEPKGIFDLLNAVNILEKRRRDFSLHLIGSAVFEGTGEIQEEIQKEVMEIASRLNTVKVVGPLSHPKLAEYLKGMDIGVFPSNHKEPFGNVVVEMMAGGLPVIAYDIGGPREIIEHNETGYLVPNRDILGMANAIEELIAQPEKRYRLGDQGRLRAQHYFNWARHVDELVEIYEMILRAKE